MVDIIDKVAITNLADKYFLVRGKAENFSYFAWPDAQIPNGGINIGASGAGTANIASMQVEGKDQITERQSHLSGQQVAQKSVILTTKERTTKGALKKKSFSFPRTVNNIWITYALNKYIKEKDKIKSFKGAYTYKQGKGGRFVIGSISDAIMSKTINDYLAAKQAAATKGREGTTTVEEIEQA